MATTAQRAHLHTLMQTTAAHRVQLDYPPHDQRTAADSWAFGLSEQQAAHVLTSGGHLQFDCSQGVTMLCKWAGLQDPNGLAYRWAGYTGTLLAHLPHYSKPVSAMVGALVVFGPGTGEHVAMVMEPGADPLLWSHGQPGLNLISLSQERRYHSAPTTFLSIAHL